MLSRHNTKEFKISQYTDDTSQYIQPDEESLKECINVYLILNMSLDLKLI